MSSSSGVPVGTGPQDYDDDYYRHYAGGAYGADSEHWRRFFDDVAARLVAMFSPSTSLDAGCAKGILVGSLSQLGVEAYGVDLSPTAIEDADPRAGDRVRVGSLADPLDRRFDLITCIEVIEHLSQPEAERALDNLCSATDLLVLSSTPREFSEVTHVNVRPPGHWAAMLADRGFVRRFDVDLAFLSPWAVAYERRLATPRSLVHDYETALTTVLTEIADKRQVLLETQASLSAARAATERERELTAALLVARDHVRGLEATSATAVRRADRLQADLVEAAEYIENLRDQQRAEIAQLQRSWTWRAGRILTAPLRLVRRLVPGPR